MQTEKLKAEVKAAVAKKETGTNDDMPKTVSHVQLAFAVPRRVIDALFPIDDWTHQFYRDGGKSEDTCLDELFPVKYHQSIDNLRVSIDFGSKEIAFEDAKIMSGMKLTPEPGHFVTVLCKVKLYTANREQSGEIDRAVKESVHVQIEPMNYDIEDQAKAA